MEVQIPRNVSMCGKFAVSKELSDIHNQITMTFIFTVSIRYMFLNCGAGEDS